MFKLKTSLLAIITICSSVLYSQNLVQNASFEDLYPLAKIDWAKNWDRVKTPDLLHTDARNPLRNPNSDKCRARFNAKSGKGFIMIRTYEEVAIGNCEPLIKGHRYRIGAWVRKHPHPQETSNFWIWVASGINQQSNFFDPPAQFVNRASNFISWADEWREFSSEFIAKGGENKIAVGGVSRSPKHNIGGYPYSPWVFIDDVSIIDITSGYQIETNKPIRLENIFFNTGQAELLPESFVELDKLYEHLLTKVNQKVEIAGHTDNAGQKKMNQKLSTARAKAIYDYLIDKGIDANLLSYVGYGSTKPIADNNTKEGMKQNRRVEVRMLE